MVNNNYLSPNFNTPLIIPQSYSPMANPYGSNPYGSNPAMAAMMMQQQMQMQQNQSIMLGMNAFADSMSKAVSAITSLLGGAGGRADFSGGRASSQSTAAAEKEWSQCKGCQQCS